MIKKLIRNHWIIFAPFLFYYSFLIVQNKWPSLYGDEIRYVNFAKNLLHGFYSPPAPHINLWNGPGYPLLLVPFEALHLPDIYPTLMNALFLYMAVVFLYKAIVLITAKPKIAMVAALLMAMYSNTQAMLPILYTEAFTEFLISVFVYLAALCFMKGKTWPMVLAGLILGLITLTKIIFAYVLIVCFFYYLLQLLFNKSRLVSAKAVCIFLIAFGLTVPYLVYTWQLTQKVFYWGNSGGMSLYWMSTPFEHEYGDWKLPNLSNHQYPILYKSAETVEILKRNHSKELSFILGHNELQQDELFKQKALQNIKNNPSKFMSNYGNNLSRMLFNFPYSYAYQDAAIVRNIVTGSLILWSTVIALIITILNWRHIVFSVKMILMITAVYILLSGTLSSYPRQLDVMLPALLFWIGYLIANIRKISLAFADQ